MEIIEHGVKDDSDFHEEVVLDGSNVDNIFLDEKCFFVGLEEDVEVRSEKFNIDLCVFDSLLSSSL